GRGGHGHGRRDDGGGDRLGAAGPRDRVGGGARRGAAGAGAPRHGGGDQPHRRPVPGGQTGRDRRRLAHLAAEGGGKLGSVQAGGSSVGRRAEPVARVAVGGGARRGARDVGLHRR